MRTASAVASDTRSRLASGCSLRGGGGGGCPATGRQGLPCAAARDGAARRPEATTASHGCNFRLPSGPHRMHDAIRRKRLDTPLRPRSQNTAPQLQQPSLRYPANIASISHGTPHAQPASPIAARHNQTTTSAAPVDVKLAHSCGAAGRRFHAVTPVALVAAAPFHGGDSPVPAWA